MRRDTQKPYTGEVAVALMNAKGEMREIVSSSSQTFNNLSSGSYYPSLSFNFVSTVDAEPGDYLAIVAKEKGSSEYIELYDQNFERLRLPATGYEPRTFEVNTKMGEGATFKQAETRYNHFYNGKPVIGSWYYYYLTVDEGIIDLAHRGAELIVLQELHNSLYFCQVEDVDLFDLAEPIPGPSTDFYGKLAKDLGVVIVTSLFERRAPGLYHNTAVVMEKDGSIAGKYRKMHIPDDPAYYEKFYFTPGDLGFHPIQTSVGKLGVLVCWDQWYPEAARLMALQGAEMLIYPTAIGYATYDTEEEQQRQREAWTTVMRGHAVANGLPVIAVNRVGFEPDPSGQTEGIQFWGSSFVAGPQGELHYRASDQEEESLVVDIDLKHSENVRRWWPFLRDRRIENYGDITRRFID
jgi:N-carbamoylputrescine amidase